MCRVDRLFYCLHEINAARDIVEVHEHASLVEMTGQAVVQPTGIGRRILAPVADEYSDRDLPPAPRRAITDRRPGLLDEPTVDVDEHRPEDTEQSQSRTPGQNARNRPTHYLPPRRKIAHDKGCVGAA